MFDRCRIGSCGAYQPWDGDGDGDGDLLCRYLKGVNDAGGVCCDVCYVLILLLSLSSTERRTSVALSVEPGSLKCQNAQVCQIGVSHRAEKRNLCSPATKLLQPSTTTHDPTPAVLHLLLPQIPPLLPQHRHILLHNLRLHHSLVTLIHRGGRAAKIELRRLSAAAYTDPGHMSTYRGRAIRTGVPLHAADRLVAALHLHLHVVDALLALKLLARKVHLLQLDIVLLHLGLAREELLLVGFQAAARARVFEVLLEPRGVQVADEARGGLGPL